MGPTARRLVWEPRNPTGACRHSTSVPGDVHTSRTGRRWAAGRTLHLIDVENLVGGSQASAADVVEALDAYREAIAVRPADHVVIASGRRLLIDAGLAWPGARLVLGSGTDGADLALLEACSPASVAAAYDRVVIGSGDGIFAARAVELRRAGVVVVVVSLPASLAIDLRDSAALVRPLVIRPDGSTQFRPLRFPIWSTN